MRDDESVRALDITLAETKALYSLLSASEESSCDACDSIKAKLEERLYDILTLEEMEALTKTGKKGN
jgi:DNA-binding transcriptional MerR regulator